MHDVGPDQFEQRAVEPATTSAEVGAVGEDDVEIAGIEIGQRLVGGLEGEDGVAGREVLLGIGGLDGRALDADPDALEIGRSRSVLAGADDELGRIGRK